MNETKIGGSIKVVTEVVTLTPSTLVIVTVSASFTQQMLDGAAMYARNILPPGVPVFVIQEGIKVMTAADDALLARYGLQRIPAP